MGDNPFDRVNERLSAKLSEGQKRPDLSQKISFIMPVEECAPNTFDSDIQLTLKTTTPAQEATAARAAQGDAISMALKLAETSLYAVASVEYAEDGTPSYGEKRVLKAGKAEKELVWSWLGPRGRNISAGMFAQITAPANESLGKADKSIEIF